MTAYLLDTNHLSPLVTAGHPLRQRVLACLEAGDTFAFAVPALVELGYGLGLLPRAPQNLAEWGRLRPAFICYIPDEADAERAAQLRVALRQQGWQLDTVDALLAVIALRYDLVLLTTDKDFSVISQLKQANWLIGGSE